MSGGAINEEQLEDNKRWAREIIRLVLQIPMIYPGSVDRSAYLAKYRKTFHIRLPSGATEVSVINMITPEMLGESERELFSDVAALGQFMLHQLEGGPPGTMSRGGTAQALFGTA